MTNQNHPPTTQTPANPTNPGDRPAEAEPAIHPPMTGEPTVPPLEPFETFDSETQTIQGVDLESSPASLLWSTAIQESLDDDPDAPTVP